LGHQGVLLVKMFLTMAAALMMVLGTGWLLAPEQMLAAGGSASDAAGVYLGRRYGGMFFGYATVLSLARNAAASSARSAIFGGVAVVAGLMTCVTLFGIAIGAMSGPVAWSTVVIEASLSVGFLYCYRRG
jgi:hypothetical protein